MKRKVVINTHIEKTAGTSLLNFFETVFGEKNIAFYDPSTDSIIRVSDLVLSPSNKIIDKFQLKSHFYWPYVKKLYFLLKSKKRTSTTIPQDVVVIHGHFKADRFDHYDADLIRTIIIRDPLQRMLSQYKHWKQSKGRNQWRVHIPYHPSITFEKYALLPQMKNYQTQAMAGKKLSDFDVVGVAEEFEMYLSQLLHVFHKEGLVMKKSEGVAAVELNQREKKVIPINEAFQKVFSEFHKEDYLLYEEAKKLSRKGAFNPPKSN